MTVGDTATEAGGTFVFRLIPPRPTFAFDQTDEEREVMNRHAAHWQPLVDLGQMVFFGPVLDDSGSWGLGIVQAADEHELRAFAASDPVVTTSTGEIWLGKMLGGFVRAREGSRRLGGVQLSEAGGPDRGGVVNLAKPDDFAVGDREVLGDT